MWLLFIFVPIHFLQFNSGKGQIKSEIDIFRTKNPEFTWTSLPIIRMINLLNNILQECYFKDKH